MSTIGNWKVIGEKSLIVPQGKEARFSLETEINTADVVVLCENSEGKAAHVSYDYRGSSYLRLVFQNWTNPLGTAIHKPFPVMEGRSGQMIAILACGWYIGSTIKLDITFLTPGKNEHGISSFEW